MDREYKISAIDGAPLGSVRHPLPLTQASLDAATAALPAAAATEPLPTEVRHVARAGCSVSELLGFLAETKRVLPAALDERAALSAIAQIAISYLADWCVIDLVDDEANLHRSAAAHVDPAQATLVQSLLGTWSPSPEYGSAISAALNASEPQVQSGALVDLAQRIACGPAALAVVRQLQCQSLLVAPLRSRDRVLGTLTLVSTKSAERYGPDEVLLASDLANRAALIIENARLNGQTLDAARRRDEFLAMLAHELRNPLAAIQNSVDVLRQPCDVPLQQRARDMIERQGQNMARMLDDLLDIARVTRGKIKLQRQVLDIRAVIEHAVRAAEPQIRAREHRMSLSITDEALHVDADPTRLEQVLLNLLHNAAKYTAPGGDISLVVEVQNREAVILVRDTGVGIAAEDLPYIFDLFVQADHTIDRTHGGLGLGLTMVRSLVELHGGSATAFSDGKGHGCEFIVRLPLAARRPRGADQVGAGSAEGPRRIVIVEDNEDVRTMLELLLQMEGHQIVTADDGLSGVKTILHEQPDVALVDIGLPGVDGFEVARRVRAELGQQVYLVAVTGYGQAEDIERSKAAGFDEHLVKPVRITAVTEILATIVPAVR